MVRLDSVISGRYVKAYTWHWSIGVEVLGAGMVEHQRGHRRLGIHNEAFGQCHADLLGVEESPQRGLIGEVRARRIAEGHANAAVASLELVGDRQIAGVGESPERPEPGVQHLGERLGALRSEEHTSELQSQSNLVCRLLLDKTKRAR